MFNVICYTLTYRGSKSVSNSKDTQYWLTKKYNNWSDLQLVGNQAGSGSWEGLGPLKKQLRKQFLNKLQGHTVCARQECFKQGPTRLQGNVGLEGQY